MRKVGWVRRDVTLWRLVVRCRWFEEGNRAVATFYFLLFTFHWFIVRQRYDFPVFGFQFSVFTNFAVSVPLAVTTIMHVISFATIGHQACDRIVQKKGLDKNTT